MAQETAVMQLLRFILVERRQEDGSIKFHAHEDFSRFLQIEKDQIVDAWHSSHVSMMTGEQYYEETYKK